MIWALVLSLAWVGITAWRVKVEGTYVFDWDAYMEQADAIIAGEREYGNIRGDTGALVYPAGHAWIHVAMKHAVGWDHVHWTTEVVPKNMTGYEERTFRPAAVIRQLQWGYLGLMGLTSWFAMDVAERSGVSPWFGVFLLMSRRLPAIYALGLFNDCWAMLFAMGSVWALVNAVEKRPGKRWGWLVVGAVLFSLGVGVKMNVLLMAPAVLAIFLTSTSSYLTTLHLLFICAEVQAFLGWEFLAANTPSYLASAFNFGRQFDQSYSVNFNFLPPSLFTSKTTALLLLLLHVLTVTFFTYSTFSTTTPHTITPKHVVFAIFGANLIGIAFARSLHYQFLSWYWWTLPTLCYHLLHPISPLLSFLLTPILLLATEICWNIHPPTQLSSFSLTAIHFAFVLALLLLTPRAFAKRKGE